MEEMVKGLEASLRERGHLLGRRRRHVPWSGIGGKERVTEHLQTRQSSRRLRIGRGRFGIRKDDGGAEAGDGDGGSRHGHGRVPEEHGTAISRGRDGRRVGCVALVGIGGRVASRTFVATTRSDVDAFRVGAKASGTRRHAIALEMLTSLNSQRTRGMLAMHTTAACTVTSRLRFETLRT